jgi:hypothetical protein
VAGGAGSHARPGAFASLASSGHDVPSG